MYLLLLLSACSFSLPSEASLLQKRKPTLPPTVSSVDILGTTFDSKFPNVYRDNGGGGNISGINFVVFADTTITSGGPNGAMTSFASNTIAAMVHVCFPTSLKAADPN